MKRLIRNISRTSVKTNYNGHEIVIIPKGTMWVDDEATGEHLADYLLTTFGFLRDDTPKTKFVVEEIQRARGVKKFDITQSN